MKKLEELTNKYFAQYKAENYTHWSFIEYLQHLCRINLEERTQIMQVIAHEQYIDELLYDLKFA
jgi:hypothetical protein